MILKHGRAAAMENNLGPVIKRIRERAGMSQKDLAHRVGITPSGMNQIENRGTVNPKINLLARIFYELKCPIGYAFWKAGLPAYMDNPGSLAPPLVEINEIIKAMPEGPKRETVESLLLETARAWRDYDD